MHSDVFNPNIILYFIIITVVYFATFIFGRTFYLAFKNKNNENNNLNFVFNSLFTGFIAYITIFALFITRGDSVFLLSFFLVIYFILTNKLKLKNPFVGISKREILSTLIVYALFVLIYLLHYYFFFIRSGGEIFHDFNWYANVTNGLLKSGVESMSWFARNTAPTIYHYGDMWFTAFWAKLFSANHVYILLLITNTFLISMVILSAYLLFMLLTFNKKILSFFLSILLLVFNPILTYFFSYKLQILSHPKFYITALFFIFFAINYYRVGFYRAFPILLLLVPFNTLVAPGVLSGLFFFSVYSEFKIRKFKLITIFNQYTWQCLFFLVFLILFYGIRTFYTDKSVEFIQLYDNPIVHSLKVFIYESIYAIIRVIPIVIILFILKKYRLFDKKLSNSYFELLVLVLTGAFFSALTSGVFSAIYIDGIQLAVNYNVIIVGITAFIGFVFVINKISEYKRFKFITYGIILCMVLICAFHIETIVYPVNKTNPDEIIFYNKLKQEFDKKKPENFGYFRNYSLPENFDTPASRLRMILPLNEIVHIAPDGYYAPICLSAFEIPEKVVPKFNERHNSLLKKYSERQRNRSEYISRDSTIVSFIHEMKINYIIFETGSEIPAFLSGKQIIAEFDGNRIIRF